ncbi:McrC family protein [Kitasatospora sp. NPDC051705]|uniref:McrC family protein n=1 Tax=Kitasatospora sp. NPDC051705 TaxID=3364057 RepID=UPI00378796B5
MIRINLTESGSAVQEELTAEQAAALAASGIVRVEQGRRAGLWRVSGRRLVGAARINGVDLRISPKTPINQVLFLLGYAAAPGRWRSEPVTAAESEGLLPAVSYAFVRAAERATRHGPLQGYRTVEDTLPVIRGRVRPADQLRRHFGRSYPAEVSYEEFTEDIAENRILKAAAHRLLSLPDVPTSCRAGLRRVVTALSDVGEPEGGPPQHQPGSSGVHDARFDSAVRLGELVLRGASYDLQHRGTVYVDGLLLNMEKVFQDFVVGALADALRPYGGTVHPQDRRHFLDHGGRVQLLPDLVWCRNDGRPAGVADAKYKAEKIRGHPNADLYQMASYCLGLGLDRGHLVYAAGEAPVSRHTVRNSGIELVRHAVQLAAEPAVVLDAMAVIAADIAAGLPGG